MDKMLLFERYSICYICLCDTSFVAYFKGKLLYHVVCDMGIIDEMATVAERIRFYRTKRGVTSNTLAELTGVSRYAVMRYESGETEPALDDLKKMAAVLGIEADKLYDDYYRFLDYPYSTKIKEIRKAKRLLQRELGERLCVTPCTVKRWEYGKHTVTRDMWKKIKALSLL